MDMRDVGLTALAWVCLFVLLVLAGAAMIIDRIEVFVAKAVREDQARRAVGR